MEENNRRHFRLQKEFYVEYTVLSGDNPLSLLKTRTIDLSLSGTKIETAEPLSAGDQLSVRIEVPDLKIIEGQIRTGSREERRVIMCFGLIRWIQQGLTPDHTWAGIEFQRMSTDDRIHLARLLELSNSGQILE